MNEKILLYDVYDDNKNVINSQVILDNNIGFEIPNDYYFKKETTNLSERILHILNDKHFIRLYYEMCDEKSFKQQIEKIQEKYKITEDFTNYRGQKIIEYENETGINIMSFDGTNLLLVNSKCHKYSDEYYVLYFIVFSFDSNCQNNYDNVYYQKNNYCILKNAKYIYDNYGINLIKHNPFESLEVIDKENFCKYINGIVNYDEEIDNYYMSSDKTLKSIVYKIENYKSNEMDDSSFMDLVEEE